MFLTSFHPRSFKTGNESLLQQYRVSILRNLHFFNDDSVPESYTLQDLKLRRMKTANKMIGRLGNDVNIVNPFFIGWGCNTFIGDNVYINRECVYSSFLFPFTPYH